MRRNVQIEDRVGVQIDGMKAFGRPVDHLDSLSFLDRQIHDQRFVDQIRERLQRDEVEILYFFPALLSH